MSQNAWNLSGAGRSIKETINSKCIPLFITLFAFGRFLLTAPSQEMYLVALYPVMRLTRKRSTTHRRRQRNRVTIVAQGPTSRRKGCINLSPATTKTPVHGNAVGNRNVQDPFFQFGWNILNKFILNNHHQLIVMYRCYKIGYSHAFDRRTYQAFFSIERLPKMHLGRSIPLFEY